MAQFILERTAVELSRGGTLTRPAFVATVHGYDSVARVKPGDIAELVARINTSGYHRPDSAMPAVSGVRWSLDGETYTADNTASEIFDATYVGVAVWAMAVGNHPALVSVDLTALQSGIVSVESLDRDAPTGTDAGAGMEDGTTPLVGARVPSGTDAGDGTDDGTTPIASGSVPAGTDAGVGGSTGTTPRVGVRVPTGTDAGVGASTGTTPTASLFWPFSAASGGLAAPETDRFALYISGGATAAYNGSGQFVMTIDAANERAGLYDNTAFNRESTVRTYAIIAKVASASGSGQTLLAACHNSATVEGGDFNGFFSVYQTDDGKITIRYLNHAAAQVYWNGATWTTTASTCYNGALDTYYKVIIAIDATGVTITVKSADGATTHAAPTKVAWTGGDNYHIYDTGTAAMKLGVGKPLFSTGQYCIVAVDSIGIS